MKIILEDFDYKGMHFDKYEEDLPQLGDVYEKCLDNAITTMIKENLDKKFWREVNTRT